MSRPPPDVSDEDPCFGAFDGSLPILGQSAATSEPGESAFCTPFSRDHLKTFGGIGARHDLNDPSPDPGQGPAQSWPGIPFVREDMAQSRRLALEQAEHIRRVTVLKTGRMDPDRNQMAAGLRHDMALAPLDPLSGVRAANAAAFSGFHALAVNHPLSAASHAPRPDLPEKPVSG